MRFEKNVLFLGMTANMLRDGGVYYTVQFFEPDGSPVSVNVMDNDGHAEVLSVLRTLSFGDRVSATFFLRQQDRLYKLLLADAVPC